MERLDSIYRNAEFGLYSVDSDRDTQIEEYIFSTPETRRVCNEPELVGLEFPRCMRQATVRVLRRPPLNEFFRDQSDRMVSVMHFLRGGLNFQLRDALAEAYGFNKHYCAYMTSQRHKDSDEWVIEQDQYRKIRYLPGSTLLIGDVIATGSTLENGLDVLIEHAESENAPFRNLIVFTIGCDRGRQILDEYVDRLRRDCGVDRVMLFYAEGKFGLAKAGSSPTIKIPGTDLLRDPALLAPEYERSLYDRLHIAIERCAIYDVGAKSFEYQKHIEDVCEYWNQLIESNLTLKKAYRERWSEQDYGSVDQLFQARKETWPFIDREEIIQLYNAYRDRWENETRLEHGDTHQALVELAEKRLDILEELLYVPTP